MLSIKASADIALELAQQLKALRLQREWSCRVIIFVISTWLVASSAWGAIATLHDVRISSGKDKSRVVFDLSQVTTYKLYNLHNPERVVVDFDEATLGGDLTKMTLAHSPIKRIRSGRRNKKQLRIVLDLKGAYKTNDFFLNATEHDHYRLVVDLLAAQTAKKELIPKITLPFNKKPRNVVIVIDPGHGGKDPGAVGHRGTREKQVVLAIAKDLKKMIDKESGMHAILTRDRDHYVTLRKRLRMARKDKADLFIAIHADAYKHKRSYGASVFALSARGASSEAARWLAAKENHSELGGVKLNDKSDLLRSVLIDLSQNATVGQSLQVGTAVLTEVKYIAKLHSDKVT